MMGLLAAESTNLFKPKYYLKMNNLNCETNHQEHLMFNGAQLVKHGIHMVKG
jgi:hypothetical protein